MAAFEQFEVGCRVCDADGFKATVRYIGPVAAAADKKEIWLGVEWDVKGRGKHDGSCVDDKGVMHRYFRCDNGSGSFIRPTKVCRGRPLSQSLLERYVSLDSKPIVEEGSAVLPEAFVTTSKGNQKPIEFVGEKKIRERQQLTALLKVSARNDNVSSVDSLSSVSHLVEVDLQDNLLYRWEDVTRLGEQLPALQCLLLHGNKLLPLEPLPSQHLSSALQNLKILALNCCGLTSWSSVQALEALPCLEELYLAHNHLADLPRCEDSDVASPLVGERGATPTASSSLAGFARLRILDITGCELQDWAQVKSLGGLASLQELLLDLNPLPSILPCEPDSFPCLTRLSVAGSQLASWSALDMLATYPGLQVLRLSSVPLFAGKGASEVRPLVIARLPDLIMFNGSTISPKERELAEKLYVRLVYRELDMQAQTADGVRSALSLVHPRFQALAARYADDVTAEGAAAGAAKSKTLSSELCAVTFRNLSFGSGGSLEPVAKKLPRGMTVTKLRVLVKQLFGLEPVLQQLSLRVYKDSPPTLLEDEDATLQYYGVTDGAEIFVNEAKACV